MVTVSKRAWDGVVVKAVSRKVPGSIPDGVTGDFFRGTRQFDSAS
jgi:hypothetical protein